jgi:EpsI family protein
MDSMAHPSIRIAIVISLMLVTLGGVSASRASHSAADHQPNWTQVSYQLKDWRGKDTSFDPVYGIDPATSSMLRSYRQGDAQLPVVVYAGFHSDLTSILDFHVPTNCYPAQGWKVVSEEQFSPGNYRGTVVRGDEIIVDKEGNRRLVSWWFNAGAKPFSYRMRYVFTLFASATITGRTDGSIVRLETPLEPGIEGEFEAQERVNGFARALLPSLEKALPR